MRIISKYLTPRRKALLKKGVAFLSLGLLGVAVGDPALAAQAGIGTWGTSMVNALQDVPSIGIGAAFVGGAGYTVKGLWDLYHHIDDGGRISEKSKTVMATVVCAGMMASSGYVGAIRATAPAATNSGIIQNSTANQ